MADQAINDPNQEATTRQRRQTNEFEKKKATGVNEATGNVYISKKQIVSLILAVCAVVCICYKWYEASYTRELQGKQGAEESMKIMLTQFAPSECVIFHGDDRDTVEFKKPGKVELEESQETLVDDGKSAHIGAVFEVTECPIFTEVVEAKIHFGIEFGFEDGAELKVELVAYGDRSAFKMNDVEWWYTRHVIEEDSTVSVEYTLDAKKVSVTFNLDNEVSYRREIPVSSSGSIRSKVYVLIKHIYAEGAIVKLLPEESEESED